MKAIARARAVVPARHVIGGPPTTTLSPRLSPGGRSSLLPLIPCCEPPQIRRPPIPAPSAVSTATEARREPPQVRRPPIPAPSTVSTPTEARTRWLWREEEAAGERRREAGSGERRPRPARELRRNPLARELRPELAHLAAWKSPPFSASMPWGGPTSLRSSGRPRLRPMSVTPSGAPRVPLLPRPSPASGVARCCQG